MIVWCVLIIVFQFNTRIDLIALTGLNEKEFRFASIAEMGIKDFFDWPDCSSKTKRTEDVYMKDIVYVRAKRGKKTLVYKTGYNSSEEFELDFLQFKAMKNGIPAPQIKTNYRGIAKSRKENIIRKLGPLMPDNRLSFLGKCSRNSSRSLTLRL